MAVKKEKGKHVTGLIIGSSEGLRSLGSWYLLAQSPSSFNQDWYFVLYAWVEDTEKWEMFYEQELGGCYDMGGSREKTVCVDSLS